MTIQDLGQISTDGDTCAVRLERELEEIPDEVWRALTEPDRLREWLARTEIDPREGGELSIDFSSQPDGSVVHGVIRIYDPPRTLEYDWSETGANRSAVRFELEPTDSGTKLTLTHRLLTDEEVPGFGAGWHAHLDALIQHLQGVGPSRERFERLRARYLELRPVYAEIRASARP
jgi:uncharacterized protein YndB with AHSA1/START domain